MELSEPNDATIVGIAHVDHAWHILRANGTASTVEHEQLLSERILPKLKGIVRKVPVRTYARDDSALVDDWDPWRQGP